MAMDPLLDGHGRRIGDLRVSVTDRCNFRCQYCMPAEGLPWLERDEVLSFEEIERLVALLAAMGVARRAPDRRRAARAPRLPARWSAMLARVDGVEDLSLTTNGYLLERDAEALVTAGINRFNVSIDSLQRDRFFEITRRDALPQVLRGLEALAAYPEAHPIKVNAVAMRDFTEEEALPFAEFAREHPYQVRFIEFMPLDGDHAWSADAGPHRRRDPRAIIDAVLPARARAARAARDRARLPLRRRPRARSASSTRSPSRSAATATASASPPRASCAPACSRSTRPTCASRCAPAPPTTSSSRSSATPSGARSSSTTSTSRASSSRRAR